MHAFTDRDFLLQDITSPDTPARALADSQAMTILVAEDSVSERAVLRSRLEAYQHRVEMVDNGTDAVMRLIEDGERFDLVLLDIRMPGLDGYQVAARIRQHEQANGDQWRPIIFLSGFSRPEEVARAIEVGGDDFLCKPIDSVVLKAKITAMGRIAVMRRKLLDAQRALECLATIDELTGLANRRQFRTLLEREMARARRHSSALAVAYADIDHFKTINDTFGHEAGDAVLRSFATRLSAGLRCEDVVGRLGGEEFCVCLPSTDAVSMVQAAERYRQMIGNQPFEHAGGLLTVTASFGVAQFQPQTDDIDTLLGRADRALYEAKNAGRNRVAAP